MKALAKGTSSEPIFKLLKVTIDTHQQMFAQALINSEGIDDIADKVQTNKKLFADDKDREDNGKKQSKLLTDDMFDPSNLNNLPDLPE